MEKGRAKPSARGKVRGRKTKLAMGIEGRLTLAPVEQVVEGLGFWSFRLKEALCPGCGTKASLTFEIKPYGLEIYCARPPEDCTWYMNYLNHK